MKSEAERLLKAFLKTKRNRTQLTICLDRLLEAQEYCFRQITEKELQTIDRQKHDQAEWHPAGNHVKSITLETFQNELTKLVTVAVTELHKPEALLDFGNGLLSLANHVQRLLIDLDGK